MPDLMAALEQSIAAAKAARATQRVRPEKGEPPSHTGPIAPSDPSVNVSELVRHRSETDAALERFTKALELGDRIARDAEIGGLFGRLIDAAQGQPGAQSYDGPRRSGIRTEPFFFVHQTDHRGDDDADCPHTEQVPVRPDPTGNAAARQDKARALIVEVQAEMSRVVKAVGRIMDIYESVLPRDASSVDVRAAEQANRKDDGCQSCARVPGPSGAPWWSPIDQCNTAGGNLAEPMALCHWCRVWVLEHGDLPTLAEMRRRAIGERVMRAVQAGS